MAVCLLLNGCAVAFVYRHADWLMLHKLDQYFDLSAEQRRDLTGRIQTILAKHRREALPQYEAFLVQIHQRLERGLTGDDVEWFYASFDKLRDDLFDRLVVDGGVFLASVNESQTVTLERAMRKDNEKAAKLASGPPQERLKKRADNTVEVVKDWTGSLSREQRNQIAAWSYSLPDTQPMFFRYREERQEELLTLLRHPRSPEQAANKLRAALVHPDKHAPAWYLRAVQDWRNGIKELAPRIDRTLSHSQRRYALDKLQRLIVQVRDLYS
ncbi:MAG TPA: DUF6279 family lipoprotein [Nitrospiraceae bacterium]|nr:DUF6279 family lipoprotein [Nitrospiraceae bacterium]